MLDPEICQMVFQCSRKHSCIVNRLLWKAVGCQPSPVFVQVFTPYWR